MLELWNRLLGLLRARRSPHRRYFALEESLQSALVQRADQEQRPEEDIRAEVLAAGLVQLQSADGLKQIWSWLSRREQEVTALACLGYTNRQIAGRLNLSEETVKTYMSKSLAKFDLHSKAELRQALSGWDFGEWGPPQA
jgi:two-component system, NarL family, nitrate/nitrite response regulator NarL